MDETKERCPRLVMSSWGKQRCAKPNRSHDREYCTPPRTGDRRRWERLGIFPEDWMEAVLKRKALVRSVHNAVRENASHE